MKKICRVCQEEKDIRLFLLNNRRKDGYDTMCKPCNAEKRRKNPLKPKAKNGHKFCAKCNVEKELNDFNVRFNFKKHRPFSYCKECERKMNRERYENVCSGCNKFYKSGSNKNNICRECYHRYLKEEPFHLITNRKDTRGKNNPMYGRRRFGKENPNYNPDKTEEERIQGRKLEGYGLWRIGVYERDKYICQTCGYNKGGSLVAHHLNSYNWFEEGRLDIDNGITLCKTCHNEFHNMYGFGNNTKEQFKTYANKKECLS